MAEIVIKSSDGTEFPAQPTTYKVEHEDISKATAGRTEDGTMHKDSIGTVAKIYLEFSGIPGDVAKSILSMFQKTTGTTDYMTIIYFDTKLCAFRTGTFYCGNRTSECRQAFNLQYQADPTRIKGYGSYWNLSFNLIEKSPSRW